MAFGKAPLNVADVGGWRQRANMRDRSKREVMGRRGYGGSRYANLFRPRADTPPIWGRLIAGEYKVQRPVELEKGKYGLATDTLEYYECTEHYDGRTKKSTICSAGPLWFRRQYAQPCVGCAGYFASPRDNDGRRKGRFSRRDLFVFNFYDYSTYAKVDQVDQNGIPRINEKSGQPYTEWVRMEPGLHGVHEEKEGHLMHWPTGFGHFNVIKGYDEAIGKFCMSCNTADAITRRALLCRQCETDIIDFTTSTLPAADIDKMLTEPTTCNSCGHTSTLKEYFECKGCNTPKRATVFDVDVNIQVVAHPGQTQLMFTQWSKPKPLDASLKIRPMNLPAMYSPDSLEVQEKRFGLSLEDIVDKSELVEPTAQEVADLTRNYSR